MVQRNDPNYYNARVSKKENSSRSMVTQIGNKTTLKHQFAGGLQDKARARQAQAMNDEPHLG
jgi:hypothetical protein